MILSLHSALVRALLEYCIPAQERCEPVRAGPEEGHENSQRVGIPVLGKKAESAGVAQPVEEAVRSFNT